MKPSIDQLIDGYLDRTLNDAESEVLAEWINDNPANADYVARRLTIHSELARVLGEEKLRLAARGGDSHESLIEMAALLDVPADGDQPALVDITERLEAEKREALRRELAHLNRPRSSDGRPVKHVIVIPKAAVWLGMAAAVGLAIWLGLLATSSRAPNTPSAGHEQGNEDMASRTQSAVTSVALIRSSVDAEWQGRGINANGYLEGGVEITLAQGHAEVVFGDGAAVIVAAPAAFTPIGPNAMQLISGSMTATCPETAEGFTVATTSGLITDLGTEFGIAIEDDGSTRAQVFTGKITLTPPAADDRDWADEDTVNMSAGIAALATEGRVLSATPDELAYVRSEEYEAKLDADESAYARWLAYSYDLRRDEALVAYFVPDDDALDRAACENLSPNGSLDATLDGVSLAPGRFESKPSLLFRSDNSLCRIREQTILSDFTLTGWVWIDQMRSNHVMLMGTEFWETVSGTHWQLEYTNGGRTWGMSIGVLESRDGAEEKATSWGILSPADRGRWVHLAVVVDRSAGHARFFVDGAVRDVLDYRPSVPHRFGNARIGTLRNEGRVSDPQDRHLDGRVDEMAILSRAMSDGEIQEMYLSGRPLDRRESER